MIRLLYKYGLLLECCGGLTIFSLCLLLALSPVLYIKISTAQPPFIIIIPINNINHIKTSIQYGFSWLYHTILVYWFLLMAVHQDGIQCPHRHNEILLVDEHLCVHCWIHRKTSLMSSSLLPYLCPVRWVRLTWVAREMRGEWSYNWCFMWFCFHDLLKKNKKHLAQFPSSFFSKHFVKVYVGKLYNSTETGTAWNTVTAV